MLNSKIQLILYKSLTCFELTHACNIVMGKIHEQHLYVMLCSERGLCIFEQTVPTPILIKHNLRQIHEIATRPLDSLLYYLKPTE
jgi:hypothetical protein